MPASEKGDLSCGALMAVKDVNGIMCALETDNTQPQKSDRHHKECPDQMSPNVPLEMLCLEKCAYSFIDSDISEAKHYS